MTKEQIAKLGDEELLSMLLIEDHNIESCYRKRDQMKDCESFMELFKTFCDSYEEIHKEILNRIALGHSRPVKEMKEIEAWRIVKRHKLLNYVLKNEACANMYQLDENEKQLLKELIDEKEA